MKETELPPFFYYCEAISPEVLRAQRMQELKDLAEHRKRHFEKVIAWSDPVKREEMKALYKTELDASTELFKAMVYEYEPAHVPYSMRPIFKPIPKKSFLQTVKGWLFSK